MNTMVNVARMVPTLLRVGFAGIMAYRTEMFIWALATNMPLVMMLLWTAVAADAPVGRFGQEQFGAYFLATLVVRLLTGCWLVWDMVFEIRQGTIANRLLRPVHPFFVYAVDQLSAFPMRVLTALPVAVAALWWLGSAQLTSSALLWTLLPLSLAGAWLIIFSIMAVIGTLALYWDSSLSLFNLWLALFYVLSGYTIPLELFPGWLLHAVAWLPFRFTLSFPVEIMLGLVDGADAVQALAVQWAYALGLLAAALALWRAGMRRYAVFGG